MKKVNWLLGAALLLACCSVASAKDGTIATVLDKNLGNVEKEFVSAAEAMPEDKYTFAPTEGEFKGVRSFAAQVKHVAAVNYVIAAAVLGEKPPVDTGEEAGPRVDDQQSGHREVPERFVCLCPQGDDFIQ